MELPTELKDYLNKAMQERDDARQQRDDLLAAAEAALIWIAGEGLDIHLDACASNPTWQSGASDEGPCDCLVGQLQAAVAKAKGE